MSASANGAPLRAGDLRHRVALQHASAAEDTGGGAAHNWATTAVLWARAEETGGTEAVRDDATRARARFRITLRYRADITPAARFLFRGRTLGITAARDADGQRRWLICDCEETET